MLRNIPLQQLAQATHAASGESVRSRRRALSDTIAECGQTRTPYGCVMEHMDLEVNGDPMRWPYVNPHALLYHLGQTNNTFAAFLRKHCCYGADVILYADETRPGNALRPDAGRSSLCIYWTIRQLPAWFRSRQEGWLFFGVLRARHIEGIAGGASRVLGKVLRTFWSPDGWNFQTVGVNIPNFGHFHAKFECFWGDEKEIKHFWQVKGASGTLPCCFCRNIVSRMEVVGPGWRC